MSHLLHGHCAASLSQVFSQERPPASLPIYSPPTNNTTSSTSLPLSLLPLGILILFLCLAPLFLLLTITIIIIIIVIDEPA